MSEFISQNIVAVIGTLIVFAIAWQAGGQARDEGDAGTGFMAWLLFALAIFGLAYLVAQSPIPQAVAHDIQQEILP